MRLDQPGALALLAVVAGAAVLVAQLDADAVGELLDRLGEGQVVDLLHEGDDVAALAAAEAVEHAPAGVTWKLTATARRGTGTAP